MGETEKSDEAVKMLPVHNISKLISTKTDKEFETNYKLIPYEEKETSEGITSSGKGVFNQILLTTSVLLTAAACGMPIGYSSVILPQLYNTSDPLTMDPEMGSWIASIHSAATPLGSFASGTIMDRWGRRPALIFAIMPLFTGWILIATASSHTIILCGRIVAGVAVGLIAAPAQILIAESSEPHLRGMLIGAPFVSYSLGILLVYCLGAVFHWRHVAWSGTALPMISLMALFLAYESPVWLARNGFLSKAEKALNWLRGGELYAKIELNTLLNRIEKEKALEETADKNADSFFQLMKQPSVIKPMIIINGYHILLVLSGTYLVVFYAVDIVSEFGGEGIDTMHAAVFTAIVRLIFTILYCYLLHVVNRRTMIMMCGIGSGLCSLTLSVYMYARVGQPKSTIDVYVAGICILGYIASNTGFMAMPGVMIGELLPAKIRGKYAGYIFSIFNLTLFGVTKIFPLVQYTIKTRGLFLIFSMASFGICILLHLLLPETKGKSLNEIEDYFGGNNWLWSRRHRSDVELSKSKKSRNYA